jgi:DNA-binding transcriptional LysR family regulator
MEIRELRAFVAVVEDGGLSAAARRLHVSQSALSQTVRSLERQLGARLLLRDHTGARPTEAGAMLLRQARGLIEHHDRVLAAITGAGTATGPLRIGIPLEFPAGLLPAALAQLSVTHPETRVEVRHSASAAQLDALRARDLDIGLVRDRPDDARFDAVLAVQEPMGVLVAASRAAALVEANGVHLPRLAELRWIGFARSDAPAWYDQVTATLRGNGISVNHRARDDARPVTAEVKLAAVGTGRAFALASPDWARPLPANITWHPLIDNPIVRSTWAVWTATARRRDLAALVAALDNARPYSRGT